jgi:hypothetical protein
MLIEQKIWTVKSNNWKTVKAFISNDTFPDIVLVFGSTENFKNPSLMQEVKNLYPNAILMGCTTSGEIANGFIEDDSVVCTAIKFEKSTIQTSSVKITSADDSTQVGENLIKQLPTENLKHVFVLSEGLNINGTKLVEGMLNKLPKNVNVSGGLAGDGANFKETYILDNQNGTHSNTVMAVGIYGKDFNVGYGSYGGWDIFGIERLITKSTNNVLYEIDNSPALSLYKSFLGEQSNQLPASGLLFPLSLRTSNSQEPLVRTILAVDEANQSLTFAGDMPEGSYVKLMKANIDHLIDGAHTAAERAKHSLNSNVVEFAILVSCVGRKLVMKQITEEEIEEVHQVLGVDTILTGFYSYGEISPFGKGSYSSLHNQTMTITTFSEK